MSEAYKDILERFNKLQEIMVLDDKEFRKNPKKTARIASMLVMASLYSKFSLDRQYAVFKAMKQSMREKVDSCKSLGDSVDDIAATLVYASEINKSKTG
ncbi:hypothetical protein CEE45_05370 [Candidatus Heimdallarchaeota archaeon B3_Heim]|nr:MAG: hypothetical protein CEE45_05370 [Candidatus Heimdallarchaeota archaeon B3_Heim]